MQNYLLLVLSLYAILITSALLSYRLGWRHLGRRSFLVMAVIAASISAACWESIFAAGSLFGVGPYALVVHSYGYFSLWQAVLLFSVRFGLTVVLALPAALLTLGLVRSSQHSWSGP